MRRACLQCTGRQARGCLRSALHCQVWRLARLLAACRCAANEPALPVRIATRRQLTMLMHASLTHSIRAGRQRHSICMESS